MILKHKFRSAESKKDRLKRKFYDCWGHMKARCENINSKDYKNYGERGIKIIWNRFHDFHNDMFDSFTKHCFDCGFKNTTIERIDSNSNYSKENCRWATYKEQQNNRTNNNLIEFNSEKKTLTQWAEKFGMTNKRLWARLNREGWDIQKSLLTPLK